MLNEQPAWVLTAWRWVPKDAEVTLFSVIALDRDGSQRDGELRIDCEQRENASGAATLWVIGHDGPVPRSDWRWGPDWAGSRMAEAFRKGDESGSSPVATREVAIPSKAPPNEPTRHAVIRVPVTFGDFRPKRAGSCLPGLFSRWPTDVLATMAVTFNAQPYAREAGRWLIVQNSGNGLFELTGIDSADMPDSAGGVPWVVRSGLTQRQATLIAAELNRPTMDVARSPRGWHVVVLIPDLAKVTPAAAGNPLESRSP